MNYEELALPDTQWVKLWDEITRTAIAKFPARPAPAPLPPSSLE